MRETTGQFLRVLALVTACGLLATLPLGLDNLSAAGLNNHVAGSSEYVALGDSYASGEGLQSNATTYLSPSNSDGCHRSASAYPVLVAARLDIDLDQFETYESGGFVACSGATSKDLLTGENGEPAQLSALSSATRWATLTVGGNDLHFASVLVACLDLRASVVVHHTTRSYTQSGIVRESKTCAQYLDSAYALLDVTNGTSKEATALEHVYEQIFKDAPNTELAVLNYPQLFTERHPVFCPVARGISLSSRLKVRSAQLNVGYSASQISEFNRVENEVNTAVATAVTDVSALGDNIRLVDVNGLTRTEAIPCNLATNGRSDMNALRVSVGSPLSTIVENCHFDLAHLLSLRPFVSCPSYEEAVFLANIAATQSFHPKQSAHDSMARAVEALFNQTATTTTSLNPN
jgi:lysophospholipase L1-like esterase